MSSGHSRQSSGGAHGHSRQSSGGANGHSRQNSGATTPTAAKVQNVKLVLLGAQSVGKSSIALRFVRGEFTENAEATIGAAFLTQTISLSGQTIKFDIWDTAGQERYHSLAPMYYRGAQAAVIVYDITDTKSFNKAVLWVRELKQQANAQIIMVMAGNKADMAADKRAVSREDAQAFADENNLVFTESSAKTGMCVGDIFMAIGRIGSSQFVQQIIKWEQTGQKGNKLTNSIYNKKRDNATKAGYLEKTYAKYEDTQELTRNDIKQPDDTPKGMKLGNKKEQKKKEGGGCNSC